jgi:3-oxoacyl-[acyl-carrier protein] reductase
MKLNDKVAIVVGAGSGIGRATSKVLAEEGAKVVLADISPGNADKVLGEIKAKGGIASVFIMDMTKEADCQAMVKDALEKYGQIDILCNVAGGSMGPGIRDRFGPFHQSIKEEWDRIFDINVNGARNCARAVVNHMMERRRGKIVNFSSVAGVTGTTNTVDYSAAKASVIGFTKALALEMADYNIQVNCIAPAGVATERMQAIAERQKRNNEPVMDLSRLARPEELAATVLFLVSDDVTRIQGDVILVAGTGPSIT